MQAEQEALKGTAQADLKVAAAHVEAIMGTLKSAEAAHRAEIDASKAKQSQRLAPF